jgi:hypothetical protein
MGRKKIDLENLKSINITYKITTLYINMATMSSTWDYAEQPTWFNYPRPNEKEWTVISPKKQEYKTSNGRTTTMSNDFVHVIGNNKEVTPEKLLKRVWQLVCYAIQS